MTKSILSDNQIPVPYGKVVHSEISAIMAANEIGFPVVLKPYDGNQGKGVHLNLMNERDIKAAFQDAIKYSKAVIVEQYINGNDYRVLVVGDKVCAVSHRKPASVTGDGRHTISELVEIVNQDKNRGEFHEKPLTKIRLDPVSLGVLSKKGLSPDHVPENDETVVLRENSNLSTGGIAEDNTDVIHPENCELAVRAAAAIGLDIAGIDIVADDISKPILDTGGAIVEVNAAPGIRMHLYPSIGRPRNVAKDIVDLLFPEPFDFPIVSITGTNGKTTTTRITSHILTLSGRTVGSTNTSGVYINGKCICKGDNTGPISAKMVLSDKDIDAAVLETARGGIIRSGLGYDLADVGVITNVTDDHLGLDGIKDLKEMAFVKSLVAEAVKKDGHSVLNAEDSMTGYILERLKTKVILFSKDRSKFDKYGKDGIEAFIYVSDGAVCIDDGTHTVRLIDIEEIPITYKGMVECNIENCLAAVSAAYALKIPESCIVSGLKSFHRNPGRFNIIDMKNFTVLLDYAHNKAGYEALLKTTKGLRHKRLVGVIGMPGDRPDSALRDVGHLCADAFHKIYIKEDADLRGRKKGEVADVLYSALTEKGFRHADIAVLDDELSALKAAMAEAKANDLIIVSYENMEPMMDYLNQQL